jgi:hypothetical protein
MIFPTPSAFFGERKGTILPTAPARVHVSEIVIKEAAGFALWNGQVGDSARIYLIKMLPPNSQTEVSRFLGGTSLPGSHIPALVQSLIRAQDYFSIPLCVEDGNEFIVLHRRIYYGIEMASDEKLGASQEVSLQSHSIGGSFSHVAPGFEVHGIIAASTSFLDGVPELAKP